MQVQPRQPEPIERVARALYRIRRRFATALAIALALIFGYHAVFGHNGITAYAQKRSEDKVLRTEIERLSSENARLKQHVEHLESDPDTIEHEAREQLHYTRPGEVIYTLDDRALPEAARPAEPGGSAEGRKSPSHR
jgi:cell division protein FtsB